MIETKRGEKVVSTKNFLTLKNDEKNDDLPENTEGVDEY